MTHTTTTSLRPTAAFALTLAMVALSSAAAVVTAAREARATEPPVTVRAVVHQRRAARDAGAVYVDIAVEGISAPIRLVRRVEGSCTVAPEGNPEGVFVRVTCATSGVPVTFEVARDGRELVVRRSMPPDSDEPAVPVADPAAPAPLVVIARSALPPRAAVRVRP